MAAAPPIEKDGRNKIHAPGPTSTEFAVTGMSCGNCARHVTEAIQGVPSVANVLVSLDSSKASVRWSSNTQPDVTAVIRAVEDAGYSAKVIDAGIHHHGRNKLAGWHLNLWIGLLGTGLLMLGEWIFRLGTTGWFRWLSFGIASVVQILAGASFYRGAWNQLRKKSANMDTLVALGSTTAFLYSAWALLSGVPGHVYFMESAAIITIVSLGHWLESRASTRASMAIRHLLNLAPERARRVNANGAESEVPANDLQIGDVVVLRPGDRVPTDGDTIEGNSAVDESMLTGESAPVDKTAASPLYAGTVNLNGRLLMRVTAKGDATALAQIIAAVQRAQSSRANIQRLGDRVSTVFVPVVILIAAAAGLWWGLAPESARAAHEWLARFLWEAHPAADPLAAAFIIAAAVLIVACPCAMGLATPAAIMAGTNAAAQRGILIRDGVALEKAGTITAVLLDKTGTLTAGKPTAALLWDRRAENASDYPASPSPGNRQLMSSGTFPSAPALAAALARHSSHPVSQAVTGLSNEKIDLTEWQEIRGGGVRAKLKSSGAQPEVVSFGSLPWLQKEGVGISEAKTIIEKNSQQGKGIVGVAVGTSLHGLFSIADTLRPRSRAMVEHLQRQGLRVYLVTGDNSAVAHSIAQEAGIPSDNVFAEVRPEQKAELVQKLQRQGERVAFVGDGINDAPALEQADLGIAVSRATDIARESSDIVLLNSEIEAVPQSLGLARATLRTIKQNLFWAFFYNAAGVPLAALGFMSPVLCAAAMGLSDLVVIGNALRLRRWRG